MLTGALGLERARLVSLCGAGGKTTLMFALAREWVGAGERVLITTTTKIARDEAAGPWELRQQEGAYPLFRAWEGFEHGDSPEAVFQLREAGLLFYAVRAATGLGNAAIPSVGLGLTASPHRQMSPSINVTQVFGLHTDDYTNVLRKAEGGYSFAEEMTYELNLVRGGR